MSMARSNGTATLLTRNSHHFAALWPDIEDFAGAGFVALTCVNSKKRMAAWGGRPSPSPAPMPWHSRAHAQVTRLPGERRRNTRSTSIREGIEVDPATHASLVRLADKTM